VVVDETYVKIAGRWVYLIWGDRPGREVIDVLVSQKRDLAATTGEEVTWVGPGAQSPVSWIDHVRYFAGGPLPSGAIDDPWRRGVLLFRCAEIMGSLLLKELLDHSISAALCGLWIILQEGDVKPGSL
jgi:hypothetical protein